MEKESAEQEEWYFHLFTMVYATDPQTLVLYWYKDRKVHRPLFDDMGLMLPRMKEYGICLEYTGEVFCVSDERQFVETLLLLGVMMGDKVSWPTLNNGSLLLHHGICASPSSFHSMAAICFQEFDVWYSFSWKDPSEPMTLLTKEEGSAATATAPLDKGLVFVDFIDRSFLSTNLELQVTPSHIVPTSVSPSILHPWFRTMVQKNRYTDAVSMINKLRNYQLYYMEPLTSAPAPAPVATATAIEPRNELIEVDPSSAPVMAPVEAELTPAAWLSLFADWYLEPSTENDILMSEAYQEYLTASGWTGQKVVTMTAFMKAIRARPGCVIKRRSKGMTLVGHRSLVGRQEELFHAVAHGQKSERNLLHYRSVKEIQEILGLYQGVIEACGDVPHVREACLLLHDTGFTLNRALITHFLAIPLVAEHLPAYAAYVASLLTRPFMIDHQADCESFRELAQSCVLYYPFCYRVEAVAVEGEGEGEVTLDEQFQGLTLSEGSS
jgi:hypothetical protein